MPSATATMVSGTATVLAGSTSATPTPVAGTPTALATVHVPSESDPITPSAPASAEGVIATARGYLDYPYASVGDRPWTGFSCIGLVHYVFARSGVTVPDELDSAYASAPHIPLHDLRPGDLVFFKDTVWAGLSHVSLYIGKHSMIAADSFATGVQQDSLDDPYWKRHYLGGTRPLSNPSGLAVYPTVTPVPSPTSIAGVTLNIDIGVHVVPMRTTTVYSGPGTGYLALDTVAPRTSLTVVNIQGAWANVSYQDGNAYGWVQGAVLTAPATSRVRPHVQQGRPSARTHLPRTRARAHRMTARTHQRVN